MVDLDHNTVQVSNSDDPADIIPKLPEPEHSELRSALLRLIHPHLVAMDRLHQVTTNRTQLTAVNHGGQLPDPPGEVSYLPPPSPPFGSEGRGPPIRPGGA